VTQQWPFDDGNDSKAIWYAQPERESYADTKSIATHNVNNPFLLKPEETTAQSMDSAMSSQLLNSAELSSVSVEQTPEVSILATPREDDADLTPGSSNAEACENLSTPAISSSPENEACQEYDTCFGVVCYENFSGVLEDN
jgi:hypothetical protein